MTNGRRRRLRSGGGPLGGVTVLLAGGMIARHIGDQGVYPVTATVLAAAVIGWLAWLHWRGYALLTADELVVHHGGVRLRWAEVSGVTTGVHGDAQYVVAHLRDGSAVPLPAPCVGSSAWWGRGRDERWFRGQVDAIVQHWSAHRAGATTP